MYNMDKRAPPYVYVGHSANLKPLGCTLGQWNLSSGIGWRVGQWNPEPELGSGQRNLEPHLTLQKFSRACGARATEPGTWFRWNRSGGYRLTAPREFAERASVVVCGVSSVRLWFVRGVCEYSLTTLYYDTASDASYLT